MWRLRYAREKTKEGIMNYLSASLCLCLSDPHTVTALTLCWPVCRVPHGVYSFFAFASSFVSHVSFSLLSEWIINIYMFSFPGLSLSVCLVDLDDLTYRGNS